MPKLTRFSVSLDDTLLKKFDSEIGKQAYPTRSKAVTDLIRDFLVKREWATDKEVAAAIIMIFEHHKRNLSQKLTHIQHEFHGLIISTQHVHLDHDNCMEIVIARGRPSQVERLAGMLKATKGVKFASVASASTGKDL
jgi:CopG family nickel-responsive transcriptional regulator